MNYIIEPELSLTAKGLMTILKSIKCKRHGFSIAEIAKVTRSKPEEIQKALTELCEKGYITK